MSPIQTDTGPQNKIAAHWACKIANRKMQTEILDTGTTSGTGRPEDADPSSTQASHQPRFSCSQTRAEYVPPTRCY